MISRGAWRLPPASLNASPLILKAPAFCDHPELIALRRMRRTARKMAIAHCGIITKYGPGSSQAKAAAGVIGFGRNDTITLKKLREIEMSGQIQEALLLAAGNGDSDEPYTASGITWNDWTGTSVRH